MGELVGGTTIGGYTALHSGLKEAYLGGNLTFTTDKRIIFGPNSTWGSTLSLGGNGHNSGAEQASVATTDGNLHLDAANTNGIYLNWYTGTSGVYFGNGASGGVARMTSAGDLGLGTTSPAFKLDVNGTARITGAMTMGLGATNGIKGYASRDILVDHNNANVTLSATGGGLYLGYTNTTVVRLHANLTANDGTTKIADTVGALYYKGQDTDVRYALAGSAVGNADTLDNIDSPRFVYGANTSKSTQASDFNALSNSGFYDGNNATAGTNSINSPTASSWWHLIQSQHTNVAGNGPMWSFQLTHDFHSNELYVRRSSDNAGVRQWHPWRKVWESGNFDPNSKLNTTAQAADSAKLVGVDGGLYLRRDADALIYNKISLGDTAQRDAGMYGIYDSYKIGHVWSMGSAYAIPVDGANFGNLYGIAYKHTNNTTGGTMAGGHQILIVQNGVAGVALGMGGGIWTSGGATINGSVTIGGSLNMANDPITNVTSISGQYGNMIHSIDEWLRLNYSTTHTSGIYCASSVVRTDGEFQVGANGSAFQATSTGYVTVGGWDLRLGTMDQTTRGNSGSSRALVKNSGSTLYINYAGDFTGGTVINSSATVTGQLTIQNNGGYLLDLVGADHAYIELYPLGTANGRKGYWGYSSANTTTQTFYGTGNQTYAAGGGVQIFNTYSANGYWVMDNSGSGSVGSEPTLRPSKTGNFGFVGQGSYPLFRVYTYAIYRSYEYALSSREGKTNIRETNSELFRDHMGRRKTAYDIVKGLKTYRYNRKPTRIDMEETPEQIGIMVEEAPKDILSPEGDSIETYSYMTMMLEVIKELQERVEFLEKRFK